MYYFLIPLMFGFGCNLGSAFTATFSRLWGERGGSLVSAILRNVLGIPVWMIGIIFAARTPSPVLFTSTMATTLAGWFLIIAGGVIILSALVTIRFRAARPSIQDALAQSGIYAKVRHPIHTGTLLEFAGLVLVVPILTVAFACGLGVVWVLVQTRLEEIDLLQRMPGYRDYMNAVPRFLPRFLKK
jgi:protein-S-isoprenylcysteine O-methyltransferase Ste14